MSETHLCRVCNANQVNFSGGICGNCLTAKEQEAQEAAEARRKELEAERNE